MLLKRRRSARASRAQPPWLFLPTGVRGMKIEIRIITFADVRPARTRIIALGF